MLVFENLFFNLIIITMNLIFVNWLTSFHTTTHPAALMASQNSLYFQELTNEVAHQFARVNRYYSIELFTRKKSVKSLFLVLVGVSNTTYRYLSREQRSWSGSPFGREIGCFYRFFLNSLECLISEIIQQDQKMTELLPLSRYRSQSIRASLMKEFRTAQHRLEDAEVEPSLIQILSEGLIAAMRQPKLNQATTAIISKLIGELNAAAISTNKVENIMFQHNFTSISFFNYAKNKIENNIDEITGLYKQLDYLLELQDRANSLPIGCELTWLSEAESVRMFFTRIIASKKKYVRECIELQRDEMRDSTSQTDSKRLNISLSVAHFGLFIRLFMEQGIIDKAEVGWIFNFFASNFKTDRTPFISKNSLQKKSTDVEFATVKIVKSHLIKMLNYINANFFP